MEFTERAGCTRGTSWRVVACDAGFIKRKEDRNWTGARELAVRCALRRRCACGEGRKWLWLWLWLWRRGMSKTRAERNEQDAGEEEAKTLHT
jgi:hypothetical protein